MSDNSCEARIDAQLASRLEDIPDLVTADRCQKCHDMEGCDEHLTFENVLSVDKHIYYDVLLSTGGPEDFFRVFVDGEEISGIEYHFKDWFDGAVRRLTGDQLADVEDWLRYNVYLEEVS